MEMRRYWKKHEIAVSGEQALKEAMDLLQKTGGGAVGDNKDNIVCPGKPPCSTLVHSLTVNTHSSTVFTI